MQLCPPTVRGLGCTQRRKRATRLLLSSSSPASVAADSGSIGTWHPGEGWSCWPRLMSQNEVTPPIPPRSESPPKLLPLNISQALEVALEQKELDQEPGAGKWVPGGTGLAERTQEGGPWAGGMGGFLTQFPPPRT